VTPNALLEMVEELQRHIAAEPTKYPQDNLDGVVQDLERLKSESLGTPQFEDALASAFHEFNEFKTALCGGPYRLQLIEMANPSDEVLHEWRGKIAAKAQSWLLAAGGATTAFAGQLVLGAFVMAVSIYFFLLDGPNISRSLMTLTPLDDRYKRELMREFDQISRAVVLATLLSAVIQGVLAFFGYWFAGLPSVFLLMLLTMVMALVPFVGATVVWVPACLWLYVYEERTWPAILLAVYCIAVVSTADNLVKPWVLRGKSKLHPLLALLSVLGGVQALGPLGILVGPMIVVFLQTLLNILHREFAVADRTRAA
jgi:predicted PurR-regulated permease PerM